MYLWADSAIAPGQCVGLGFDWEVGTDMELAVSKYPTERVANCNGLPETTWGMSASGRVSARQIMAEVRTR